jgi:glycosyltransferase involved in cell wall biosynthesis
VPKVTIAIPTHNRGNWVVGALESALAQTYEDREVIVVDNGSTDDTGERLAPYLDRIRYIRQENRGRAGSRNRAIEEARGDYISFLDSDDLWLPGKLERQVALLDSAPAVGLAHGHVEVIDEHGRPLPELTAMHRRLFTSVHRRGASYAGYALRCMCLTSTIMVRRDLFKSLGGYDAGVELEDLDLYLRIAALTRIAFLEGEPLAQYRYHGGQTGNESLTRGQIAVCLKHLGLLDELSVPDKRRARRNFCITLARSYYIRADASAVRTWVHAAVRVQPSAIFVRGVVRWYVLSFVPRSALLRLRSLRSRGIPLMLGGGAVWRR